MRSTTRRTGTPSASYAANPVPAAAWPDAFGLRIRCRARGWPAAEHFVEILSAIEDPKEQAG